MKAGARRRPPRAGVTSNDRATRTASRRGGGAASRLDLACSIVSCAIGANALAFTPAGARACRHDEMDRPACIFLPGIIAPTVVRYAALLGEVGTVARAYTKELELYTISPPPDDYAIADEVEGLRRWTGRVGLQRFHLYSHSGGGAVALAFTAAHPEPVSSLALDEAAFDFSDEMRADLAAHQELRQLMLEDPAQAMRRFMQLELRPGVEFTPPAPGTRRFRTGRRGSPRSFARSSPTGSTSTACAGSGGLCSTRAGLSAPTATSARRRGRRRSSPTFARSCSRGCTT